MYCPSCRSEYRPGITRCPTCDVDLGDDEVLGLMVAPPPAFADAPPQHAPEPMATFCGFLTLEDARNARDELRGRNIPAEILIRDADLMDPGDPAREEYWFRVPVSRMKQVEQLLGLDAIEATAEEAEEAEDGEEGSFACSECGKTVAGHAATCPHCGAKFDE